MQRLELQMPNSSLWSSCKNPSIDQGNGSGEDSQLPPPCLMQFTWLQMTFPAPGSLKPCNRKRQAQNLSFPPTEKQPWERGEYFW